MPTCTERSRGEINTNGWTPTVEEVQLGALQRIAAAAERSAAAAEKSCQHVADLERWLKQAREQRDSYGRQLDSERRRTAALRGVITRMKRKG